MDFTFGDKSGSEIITYLISDCAPEIVCLKLIRDTCDAYNAFGFNDEIEITEAIAGLTGRIRHKLGDFLDINSKDIHAKTEFWDLIRIIIDDTNFLYDEVKKAETSVKAETTVNAVEAEKVSKEK